MVSANSHFHVAPVAPIATSRHRDRGLNSRKQTITKSLLLMLDRKMSRCRDWAEALEVLRLRTATLFGAMSRLEPRRNRRIRIATFRPIATKVEKQTTGDARSPSGKPLAPIPSFAIATFPPIVTEDEKQTWDPLDYSPGMPAHRSRRAERIAFGRFAGGARVAIWIKPFPYLRGGAGPRQPPPHVKGPATGGG